MGGSSGAFVLSVPVVACGVDADATPDYVATLASNQHATKGEGIAGTPRWVFNHTTGLRQDNGATWGGYANGDQGEGDIHEFRVIVDYPLSIL